MTYLESQIRKALKLIDSGGTVSRGDLSLKGIGQKTITVLLENDLVVTMKSPSGRDLYSLTEKGKLEANLAPPPPAKPKRPPLKMIEPLVKTLPPRLK